MGFAVVPANMDGRYFAWLFRAALAEAIAVGIFCFVSCGAVVVTAIITENTYVGLATLDSARLLVIAFAHGMTIGITVAAICGISYGHVNPAVTLSFVVGGHLDLLSGIVYAVSQVTGGLLGEGLLKAIVGNQFGLGVHALSPTISSGKGLLTEVIITFILVFVIYGTALDPKSGASAVAPLCIGLAIFVNHLVAVPLTGASMNPARSFAAAAWSGKWANHWVYWVGPCLGAVIAAVVYQYILMHPDRPLKDTEEGTDVEKYDK